MLINTKAVGGRGHAGLAGRNISTRRLLATIRRSLLLQGHVAEEVGHGLAVVGSPDGLRQDHGNVDDLEKEGADTRPSRAVARNLIGIQVPGEGGYLYFGARLHLLFLRDGVGHHDRLERGAVDAGDGRAGEDAVREDGVDLHRAGVYQSGQKKKKKEEEEKVKTSREAKRARSV